MPCFYCGVRLRPSGPAMRTKDHVVPKSKGGIRTVESCLKCNGAKSDKSLEEFRLACGGIEFWGERQARLASIETNWRVPDPVPEKRRILPLAPERPVYAATVDLSKSIRYERAAKTKKKTKKERKDGTPDTSQPPDLRGQKFGAFTVVDRAENGATAIWRVRCSCGAFESRRTRAVRNPKNTFDACVECRKPVGKLRSDIFKETGVEVSWEDCFQYIYGERENDDFQPGEENVSNGPLV